MDTCALIEAVKACPSLYSKQDSSSTSGDQKNMLWKKISKQINQPPEKCKAKWRNLRDSYLKAIKWRRELEDLGRLGNYHEYRHEAALSFLDESSKRRKSSEKRLKT